MASKRCSCHHCHQLTLDGTSKGLLRINSRSNLRVCPECREQNYYKCPDCGVYGFFGEKTRVFYKTETCNSYLITTEVVIEKEVCPDCARSYCSCACCSDAIKVSEGVNISQRKVVCKSCFKKYYDNCLRCHKPEKKERLLRLPPLKGRKQPRLLCSSCYDQLHPIRCPSCSKEFLPSEQPHVFLHRSFSNMSTVQTVEKRYCPECFSEKRALDCGCIRSKGGDTLHLRDEDCKIDDSNIDADGLSLGSGYDKKLYLKLFQLHAGHEVCRECYSTFFRPAQSATFQLKSHSYTPSDLTFYGNRSDPMLGIELEVDTKSGSFISPDRASCLYDIYKRVGQKHIYVKSDGSLSNGLEQVTHPATLAYLMSERDRYNGMLEVPRNHGYLSHDAGTCGLHVHVGREFMSGSGAQDNISKVVYMTEMFWPELFIFSRRDSDNLNYCKRLLQRSEQSELKTSLAKGMQRIKRYQTGPSDRYMTLNLNKPETMEFRIFRGTLNPITFWATLQLVDNFVRVAREVMMDNLLLLKWDDIIQYKSYEELTDYNSRFVGQWDGKLKLRRPQMTDGEIINKEWIVPSTYVPGNSSARKVYLFPNKEHPLFQKLVDHYLDLLIGNVFWACQTDHITAALYSIDPECLEDFDLDGFDDNSSLYVFTDSFEANLSPELLDLYSNFISSAKVEVE